MSDGTIVTREIWNGGFYEVLASRRKKASLRSDYVSCVTEYAAI